MANTYKGRMFVIEPMDGKPVTDVPGIGEITANILTEKGIDEAEDLYTVYLECESNKVKFQKWMRSNCNMVPKVSDLVFEALDTWNKNFHEKLRSDNGADENNAISVPKRNRDNTGSESSSSPKEELAKQLYLNQQEQVVRSDAIMTFFVAMAKKVALLPPNVQDQVEKQVYDLIMNAKVKMQPEEASGKPVFKFVG